MTSKCDGLHPQNIPEHTPPGKGKDILEVTGSYGRWQLGVFFVLFFISLPGAGQNLAISFTAPYVDYWCARPTEADNLSVEDWKKFGLPEDDKRCSRYFHFTFPLIANHSRSDFNVVHCNSWEFDHSFYTSTLVEKYSLVCEREWLISLSKSIFMAGLLVSVVVFGYLADRIGRRPTITVSCCITFFASGTCAFSSSFILFLVARFFIAVGVGGYYNNLYVLSIFSIILFLAKKSDLARNKMAEKMVETEVDRILGINLLIEITGSNMRMVYGNAVQLGWSLGFVCLPGIVWLIRDSFWIQIALVAPYILFLGVWWMILESPRWLLSKGRNQEAKVVLIGASKMNNTYGPDTDLEIEEILTAACEDFESGETQGNLLDLLRTPGLWQITLNIVFSWFVISFIYFGLSFNTNDLVGDPFVNFAASGAVELPAYLFSIFAIRYFGRKKPIVATMIVAGLICLSSYFLPEDPAWPRSTVPVIGKFFVTSCYGIIYVFTLELFPTVVRGSGLGLANFFEQVASIIAPFMRELGNATQPYVPFVLFGIMATGSGLLTVMLTETADQTVPGTIKEAASFARGRDEQNRK